MPINYLLKERQSFGPDEIKVLATAFDAALLELGLGRTDTAALLVAKRIMALAQGGERDPTLLREGLLRASHNPALPSALQQQKRDRRALSRPPDTEILCSTAQSRWEPRWVLGFPCRSCRALTWWCSQRR
jgi:hypothetical protein